MSTNSVDIAIIGGGLVGMPLALALDQAGWQVALLEQSVAVSPPADSLDQRCTALSAGTQQLLHSWSLWSAVAADSSAINRVHISQRGYFGATRLCAAEAGVGALGHVVENRRFLADLHPLMQDSGMDCLSSADVSHVSADSQSSTVYYRTPAGDASLQARLVIAVDGVASRIRESAGIGVRQVDYQQAAVLGMLEVDRPHDQVAYERFTEGGPLALLPRSTHQAAFVYCIEPDAQSTMEQLSDSAFLQHLQSQFGYRLGRFRRLGPRTVVPLVRIEAQRQIGSRLVLLGNAARLLHPVAGQGYNLAMRDAAALLRFLSGEHNFHNELLVPAQSQRVADPGDGTLLQAFAASRIADQQRVVRLTDTLARGFRGRAAAPSHLRALGLMGLDTVAPLRQQFAQHSMGLTG